MSEKGPLAFDQHFLKIYGDRWPALKSALLGSEKQIARKNIYASDFPNFTLGEEVPRAANGLIAYYVMDPASQIPATLLNVQDGDDIISN